MSNEVVIFKNGELELEVNITPEKETVWLTQDQMSSLFDTARSSIAYHINNIFKEGELVKETSVEIFDRSQGKTSRPPMYYNLDFNFLNLTSAINKEVLFNKLFCLFY